MRLSSVWSVAATAALTLGGCAHVRPAPGGHNVSSERSDYSPTVRLALRLPVLPTAPSGDTLTIVIDSGVVSAPGAPAADTLPIMRRLYLTALLAVPAPPGNAARPVEPWLDVAQSDSVLVAEALRLGERRALGGIRLRLARPAAVDPASAWLVFRITGAAMTREVHLPDGRTVAPKSVAGGVRVYACADWTLAGYVDRRRAAALRRAYTGAC
jgi:hypothetical protein